MLPQPASGLASSAFLTCSAVRHRFLIKLANECSAGAKSQVCGSSQLSRMSTICYEKYQSRRKKRSFNSTVELRRSVRIRTAKRSAPALAASKQSRAFKCHICLDRAPKGLLLESWSVKCCRLLWDDKLECEFCSFVGTAVRTCLLRGFECLE